MAREGYYRDKGRSMLWREGLGGGGGAGGYFFIWTLPRIALTFWMWFYDSLFFFSFFLHGVRLLGVVLFFAGGSGGVFVLSCRVLSCFVAERAINTWSLGKAPNSINIGELRGGGGVLNWTQCMGDDSELGGVR